MVVYKVVFIFFTVINWIKYFNNYVFVDNGPQLFIEERLLLGGDEGMIVRVAVADEREKDEPHDGAPSEEVEDALPAPRLDQDPAQRRAHHRADQTTCGT